MRILILLSMLLSYGQMKQEKLIQQVLKENIPRRIYHFDTKDKEKTEYSIRYLGNLTVDGKNTYKIVNFQTRSVPVGRTTHRNAIILLYTDTNKYTGCYYVTDEKYLPDYLDKQDMVIVGKFRCKETTRISFAKVIPEQIYIKCTEKGGNVYTYTNEYPF